MMTRIEDLPEPLLEDVLDYLSIRERCRLLGLSRRLWAIKELHEKRKQTLTIECEDDARLIPDLLSTAPPWWVWPRRMYRNFSHNLHTLDLTVHCTDRFLEIVSREGLLPSLKHIGMRRSQKVTDRGLEHLSAHAGCGIETIDIAFCASTTYAGTFCLRDRLRGSLRLLRRQPAWLDGEFHTPFDEGAGGEVEVHTYYADGSFSFNREHQSRGFVSELSDWDDDYLSDKLQYSNFSPLPGWPAWSAYSYRPGVCLLKLPEESDEGGETVRTVLVGQDLKGLRPPKVRHLMERVTSMTTGTSTYFVKKPSGAFVRSQSRPSGGGIMISRMRVYPLDSPMPPDDLVAECRAVCERMREVGDETINRGEDILNGLLNQD